MPSKRWTSARRELLICDQADRRPGMVKCRSPTPAHGIAPDIAPQLFQPFITTKTREWASASRFRARSSRRMAVRSGRAQSGRRGHFHLRCRAGPGGHWRCRPIVLFTSSTMTTRCANLWKFLLRTAKIDVRTYDSATAFLAALPSGTRMHRDRCPDAWDQRRRPPASAQGSGSTCRSS